MQKTDTNTVQLGSKLADPIQWSQAYQALESAAPLHRLNLVIIDFFLLKSWYQLDEDHRHAYYLDIITTNKIHRNNLDSIHQILLLPTGAKIPMKPVLFSPYCAEEGELLHMILFDYDNNVALIFGHGAPFETNLYASWEEWNGPTFWTTIADLFGWEVRQNPKVIQPNWAKVNLFVFLVFIILKL
jgi:hypothetical protein